MHNEGKAHSDPAISVIMPAYNAQRHLEEALRSIFAQSFSSFELIVIDDASQDHTAEILASYVEQDPRLVLLKNNVNLGITRTRNRGLEVARGKYIACLDSDDVALPERFKKQHEFLEGNSDYVLVGSDLEIIDEASQVLGMRTYPTSDSAIRKVFTRQNPFAQPASMFVAEVARSLGGYRNKFPVCEDYDLFLRMAEKGMVANIPEVLTRYRISTSQSKSTRLKETLGNTLQVQAEAVQRGWNDSWANKVYRLALRGLLYAPSGLVLWLFRRLLFKRSEARGA